MANAPLLEYDHIIWFDAAVDGFFLVYLRKQTRDDVITCLVTGNLEPIGWGKMEALGLATLFTQPPFGGFGSDFCSGNHQVQSTLGWPHTPYIYSRIDCVLPCLAWLGLANLGWLSIAPFRKQYSA